MPFHNFFMCLHYFHQWVHMEQRFGNLNLSTALDIILCCCCPYLDCECTPQTNELHLVNKNICNSCQVNVLSDILVVDTD